MQAWVYAIDIYVAGNEERRKQSDQLPMRRVFLQLEKRNADQRQFSDSLFQGLEETTVWG